MWYGNVGFGLYLNVGIVCVVFVCVVLWLEWYL